MQVNNADSDDEFDMSATLNCELNQKVGPLHAYNSTPAMHSSNSSTSSLSQHNSITSGPKSNSHRNPRAHHNASSNSIDSEEHKSKKLDIFRKKKFQDFLSEASP